MKNIISKIFGIKRRHSFPLGWLAPEKTLEDLREYLHREWGFGGQFHTNVEHGEVLNWRKIMEDGWQYHLRVFEDGEMRGHREPSREKNPLVNVSKIRQTEAREDFFRFLGDFLSKRKYVSNLTTLQGVYDPSSEITKEN